MERKDLLSSSDLLRGVRADLLRGVRADPSSEDQLKYNRCQSLLTDIGKFKRPWRPRGQVVEAVYHRFSTVGASEQQKLADSISAYTDRTCVFIEINLENVFLLDAVENDNRGA
ncbi:unnamed protein product [Boreogadus saida]